MSSCKMRTQVHAAKPNVGCYCRIPATRKDRRSMLQCKECKQWFHFRCIQCLERIPLFGDHFFVFMCLTCNSGCEYLARVELKWVEVIHLVLYHLSVLHRQKYFDVDKAIIDLLHSSWSDLMLVGEVATYKTSELKDRLVDTLFANRKIFKHGKEVKKSFNVWGLRKLIPPDLLCSAFKASDSPNKEGEVFKLSGRKYKVIRQNRKCLKEVELVKVVPHLSKIAVKQENEIEKIKSKGQSAITPSGVKNIPLLKEKGTSKDSDLVPNRLLDSLIPVPPNFNDCYNLFEDSDSVTKNTFKKASATASKRKRCQSSQKASRASSPDCIIISEQKTFDLKQYFYNNLRCIDNHKHHVRRTKPVLRSSPKITRSSLRHLEISEDAISIIGRRVSTLGKVQYLIQWNNR